MFKRKSISRQQVIQDSKNIIKIFLTGLSQNPNKFTVLHSEICCCSQILFFPTHASVWVNVASKSWKKVFFCRLKHLALTHKVAGKLSSFHRRTHRVGMNLCRLRWVKTQTHKHSQMITVWGRWWNKKTIRFRASQLPSRHQGTDTSTRLPAFWHLE